LAWFFVNVELTLATGYLLRRSVPEIPAWAPLVLVPCFLFSIAAMLLGQTTMLVFFLMALAWRLLDRHWDQSAGVVLAWLTIKPQLTAVLLLALLVWLIRNRRYKAVAAFFVTGVLLGLVSSLVLPSWLPDMLNAPRLTPSPTEFFPWIGNTWFLLLRSLSLEGPMLWLLYLIVALPFLGYVLKAAFQRSTTLAHVLALSILAAFFVAPYARHYDFPVLLIPVMALLGKRPSLLTAALVVPALVVLPFVQMSLLVDYKASHDPNGWFVVECTYFWIPVLCLAAWFLANLAARRQRAPLSPAS
jgi:MFS family permease